MRRVEVPSYPTSIFIAGDYHRARIWCAAHCNDVGLCVTVTPTAYVYTDGEEAGVIVGLINYPRFPKSPDEIWALAETLAMMLREALGQESFTIQAPDKTVWYSWRAADNASVDTHPKGEDAKQASCASMGSAVPKADAQNQ